MLNMPVATPRGIPPVSSTNQCRRLCFRVSSAIVPGVLARRLLAAAITALLIVVVVQASGWANDLAEEPYLLRFGTALRRHSGFSAATGLQASAAHAAGWSVNPAADDVLRDPSDETSVQSTLTNLHTFTESGAWFTDTFVTASIRLPDCGTIPLSYARTDTIDTQTEQGFDNSLRSNEFFWGYSRRISDSLAVGLQSRFATAEFQEETLAPPVFAPTRLETKVLYDWNINLGVRWAFHDDWSFGVLGGGGWGSTVTDVTNIQPLPNPFPPPPTIPPGTRLAQLDDSFQYRSARIGVGYTPVPQVGVYADGEYFHFGSGLGGTLDVSRFLTGVEYKPCIHRTLRVGGSIDRYGEFTFSSGIGWSPSERLAIEFAYQRNAFPELQFEFGRFDLINFSTVIVF